MSKIRWTVCCAWLLAAALPTGSQAALEVDLLRTHGGSYLIDCTDRASARATVFSDALVFQGGEYRYAGSNVQAAYSYFGNSPPENFLVALLAELREASQMIWLVYEDDSGVYLTIDGDAGVIEAMGSLAGQRFYRCDAVPKKAPMAETPQRHYELHELSASGILMYPGAMAAYYDALGPLIEERWLAELDGPSAENTYVVIAGDEYLRAFCCKNHDCYENNIVFLYSARQKLVYGYVYQGGEATLIGEPPPEVEKYLGRLWQELFRSDSQ